MSTPAQLLNELRALQGHYAKAAERKARILDQMESQTTGTWADAIRIPLVVGGLYFVRIKWGNGTTSPASIWKWTNTGAGWATVYGNDYLPSIGDRLQVLVPTSPAPASSRRRSQGSKA